jgi:hypothetical protein
MGHSYMKFGPLDSYDDGLLLHSELLSVEAVRVLWLERIRTAWRGATSRQYWSDSVLFTTKASASRDAEARRTQGSQFAIHEIPALRLNSVSGSVVITEIDTDNPLGRWGREPEPDRLGLTRLGIWDRESKRDRLKQLRRGERMRTVVEGFGVLSVPLGWPWTSGWPDPRPDEDSLLAGTLPLETRTEPAGTRALLTWSSEFFDGYLFWNEGQSAYSRTGVRRLVRAFRRNSPDWRDAQQRIIDLREELRRHP